MGKTALISLYLLVGLVVVKSSPIQELKDFQILKKGFQDLENKVDEVKERILGEISPHIDDESLETEESEEDIDEEQNSEVEDKSDDVMTEESELDAEDESELSQESNNQTETSVSVESMEEKEEQSASEETSENVETEEPEAPQAMPSEVQNFTMQNLISDLKQQDLDVQELLEMRNNSESEADVEWNHKKSRNLEQKLASSMKRVLQDLRNLKDERKAAKRDLDVENRIENEYDNAMKRVVTNLQKVLGKITNNNGSESEEQSEENESEKVENSNETEAVMSTEVDSDEESLSANDTIDTGDEEKNEMKRQAGSTTNSGKTTITNKPSATTTAPSGGSKTPTMPSSGTTTSVTSSQTTPSSGTTTGVTSSPSTRQPTSTFHPNPTGSSSTEPDILIRDMYNMRALAGEVIQLRRTMHSLMKEILEVALKMKKENVF